MPRLVRGPTSQAAPSEYTLAPNEAFIPEAVTATFDGSGAAAAFLPALSIYAQSGELLARSPATEVAAGSSAEVTFAPLLRAAQAAAATGGGYPFAASGINGPYAVASGVTTNFGLDAGDVFGDGADSGIFTVDAFGGIFGLGVHARGFYAAKWMVQYTDRPATPVANPETFTAEAEDGSGSMIVALPWLGSIFGRGYLDLVGTATWDVSWWSLFAIHSSTGANPIIITGNQATGQPLDANTQMFVFQLSTDTFGF